MSLLAALALHLLLALLWLALEGRTPPLQLALPPQPVIHASLIAVAQPSPLTLQSKIAEPPQPKSHPLKEPQPLAAPQIAVAAPAHSPPLQQSAALPAASAPSVTEPSNAAAAGAAAPAEADVVEEEGNYTPPSSQTAYGLNPKPNYPEAVRRRGIEGVVQLQVLVDERGVPMAVDIKKSSGFSALDREAFKAVSRWRFEPARRAGVAVAGEVVVPVRFSLEES